MQGLLRNVMTRVQRVRIAFILVICVCLWADIGGFAGSLPDFGRSYAVMAAHRLRLKAIAAMRTCPRALTSPM